MEPQDRDCEFGGVGTSTRDLLRADQFLDADELVKYLNRCGEKSCRRCRFWEEWEPPAWSSNKPSHWLTVEHEGSCLRFPPVHRDEDKQALQPSTFGWDGCGEFQERSAGKSAPAQP